MKTLGLLLISTLSFSLYCERSYKRAVQAIEDQHLERLNEALNSKEITREELKQLHQKALELHADCADNVSVLSSKKDLAMLLIGTFLVGQPGWQIATIQGPKLLHFKRLIENPASSECLKKSADGLMMDQKFDLCFNLGFMTIGGILAWQGYSCWFAKRAFNRSKQILEAIQALL
jgi:hypothetical protein